MKAVVYHKYGPPEVLELVEMEKPVPKPDEVLIKVHAATVSAGDWRMRSANPFLVRLFNGLFKPRKVKILGFELAGVIEETGTAVTNYKKGDAVFASLGFKFGAYAEYKCMKADNRLALKPANVSFAEAAAVPIGGITALGFLRKAGLKAGDHILIYGASGSVGTFAIQVAVDKGATVTAVCSGPNREMVRSLGAAEVIDYTKEDFTKTEKKFDVIFDAVGKTSKRACKSLLKPGGVFTDVSKMIKFHPEDLLILKDMMERGRLRSVIDRRYTLEQIREAHTYVESFHKKGNVVIQIVPEI